MLTKLNVRQNIEDLRKKCWFQDDYFDLFIWQNDASQITNFQLCYDRLGNEHVISWDYERGFGHYRIDSGEDSPHKNMSPVFVSDELFLSHEVKLKFVQSSGHITQDVSSFITQKLDEYYQLQQLM